MENVGKSRGLVLGIANSIDAPAAPPIKSAMDAIQTYDRYSRLVTNITTNLLSLKSDLPQVLFPQISQYLHHGGLH